MKKILGIVVLGLLFGGSAYADNHDLYYDENGGRQSNHRSFSPEKRQADFTKYYCSEFNKKAVNIKLVRETGFWKGHHYIWDFECKNTVEIKEAKNDEILVNISKKKEQCEAIGFTPKTDKFADCVLRLVELDMKNQQTTQISNSNNQKNSNNNDFASKALIEIGSQLLQPNSSINTPTTRNCTIRKFGNTSRVTCN